MNRGIDLFSGARGWEARAHRTLGVDLLGIEWWEPAVLTSRAAGLRTLHADVAALDPLDFAGEVGEDGILVASPPCQSRSTAGKQLGALDVGLVARCMQDSADGRDTRAEHKAACADERSILTVEPLRWALALRPRVVLLEQVPPVLPDWKLVGSLLERFDYSWWAGILEAERFGVPQTRERAVLIARRDGVPAHPPVPTHHRFVSGEPRPEASADLFGEVLPWVSMAEALGWEDGPAPAPTVTGGGGETGGVEVFASKGARARVGAAVGYKVPYGEGMVERHGDRRAFPADEPAPVVSSKARSAEWVAMRANAQANAAVRGVGEPAPTLRFGGRSNDVSWVPTHYDVGATGRGGNQPRPTDEPAPSITAATGQVPHRWVHERPATTEELRADGWPERRPATTIAGDSRVFPPGGHHIPGDQSHGAVRVTVEQAACLQSFPPDWPWQGDDPAKPNSRTAQFTAVGNAVPPLLGEAILRTVVPATELRRAA